VLAPDVRRLAKNRSQREWGRRRARGVVLALVPVSSGVRRMLVVDEWLPEDEAKDERKLGEAIAEGFEEILRDRLRNKPPSSRNLWCCGCVRSNGYLRDTLL
jgi:hypothetical protein